MTENKMIKYGRKWVKIRRYLIEFYDYTCQNCGTKYKDNLRKLEIHHKQSKFFNGIEVFENLIVLCKKCHKIETKRLNQKRRIYKKIDKNQKRLD